MSNAIDADIAYLKIRAHQEQRREKASDPYGPAMSLYARTTGDTHYPPEIFDKIKKSIDAGFSPEQAVQSVSMTRASATPTTPRTMHTVSNFSARLAAGTATTEEIGEVHDALQVMNDTKNVQLTDSEMSKAQKLVKTLDNVIKNDFPDGKGPSVSSPEYKRFTELHGIRNELEAVLGSKSTGGANEISFDTSTQQEPGSIQQQGNRWHAVNQDGGEGDFSSEDSARKFASSGVTTEKMRKDDRTRINWMKDRLESGATDEEVIRDFEKELPGTKGETWPRTTLALLRTAHYELNQSKPGGEVEESTDHRGQPIKVGQRVGTADKGLGTITGISGDQVTIKLDFGETVTREDIDTESVDKRGKPILPKGTNQLYPDNYGPYGLYEQLEKETDVNKFKEALAEENRTDPDTGGMNNRRTWLKDKIKELEGSKSDRLKNRAMARSSDIRKGVGGGFSSVSSK